MALTSRFSAQFPKWASCPQRGMIFACSKSLQRTFIHSHATRLSLSRVASLKSRFFVIKSSASPSLMKSWISTSSSPRSSRGPVGLVMAIAVGVGATLCAYHEAMFSQSKAIVHAAEPVSNAEDSKGSVRQKYNFIAEVVEKAAPAVVYIEIHGRHPLTGRSTAVSNGSGFIVREDGLILTNAHVVANKSHVKVRLNNKETYDGQVQAVDPVSDLATVKINAKNLPTLPLGKSSDLRPGEFVVAMGSPFQLSNTVTSGIVSTPNRGSEEIGMRHKDMAYVQTDAVINFGNSGGPLVNLDGEAIGINTMKVTAGISFAIPSDYASEFLTKAREIEKRSESKGWFGTKTDVPRRKYIGITMLTLTPSLIADLKSRQDFPDVSNGVLVYKVVVGSPAYNGGIEPGDVILKINGKEVTTSGHVYDAVASHDNLRLDVQRGNKRLSIAVNPEDVD